MFNSIHMPKCLLKCLSFCLFPLFARTSESHNVPCQNHRNNAWKLQSLPELRDCRMFEIKIASAVNQICRFASTVKMKSNRNLTVACHRHPTELPARDDCLPCFPMPSFLQYCKIHGEQPDPPFCQSGNRPISVNQFNYEFRRCLAFCGLDPRRYKIHSFRIGAACLVDSHTDVLRLVTRPSW